MPSRRSVLGLAGGALAATAGCISAPTAAVSGGDVPESGQTRGEADPVTVEQTGASADNEYVPSNDTVRYPATTSGGEVDEYRYIPFEEWADVRGATVASAAVRDRLRDRFEDLDLVSVGVSNPPESGDTPEKNELQISVDHRTEIDEFGEVIDEPSVSVPELVDATPRSVTATVHFADHTAMNTYPVVVRWYTVVPLPVREENNSTE